MKPFFYIHFNIYLTYIYNYITCHIFYIIQTGKTLAKIYQVFVFVEHSLSINNCYNNNLVQFNTIFLIIFSKGNIIIALHVHLIRVVLILEYTLRPKTPNTSLNIFHNTDMTVLRSGMTFGFGLFHSCFMNIHKEPDWPVANPCS